GQFGYDLTEHLPDLFFDGRNGTVGKARAHDHQCKTRMFVTAFSKQVGEWCLKNNLEFTGHVIEEAPISAQVSFVGSAMQFYEYMSIPGIDLLTQYRYEFLAAKQCVSVARQTGRKWVLSELYGCTGWETTFETYKHLGDWQAVLGITLRCPHLSWYSMAGEAKRDYPASIHFHSPWYREYKILEDYYARLNVLLTEGHAVCDLAVIHPGESYFRLFNQYIVPQDDTPFSKITDPEILGKDRKYQELVEILLKNHLDFDFVDEHLLSSLDTECVEAAGGPQLQVGKAFYKCVLVPELTTIRRTTLEQLQKFAAAGGTVLFAGAPPLECDFEPSSDPQAFAAGRSVEWNLPEMIGVLNASCRRISIQDSSGAEIRDIFYQLRETDDGLILFMINMNRHQSVNDLQVCLEDPSGSVQQVQFWDALRDERFAGDATICGGKIRFKLDLEKSGSALLVLSRRAIELPPKPSFRAYAAVQKISVDSSRYMLDDHNVFLFDRADALLRRRDGSIIEKFSNEEILALDSKVCALLGIELRGGFSNQPWFDADKPIGPEAELSLSYRFDVEIVPADTVFLALEQPENWTIILNGRKIPASGCEDWWVDPVIKKIQLPFGSLLEGENLLELQGMFNRRVDLELIYLLGSFGVRKRGGKFGIANLPTRIGRGSWTEFGLPFYAGNVTYQTDFVVDRPGTRHVLKLEDHRATAVGIRINNLEEILLLHGEYEADISQFLVSGTNRIEIRLLGSRRNAFGPFHLRKNPEVISPFSYRPAETQWTAEIQLVDYGLFADISLMAEVLDRGEK
ncbi:MAG: hypothetical protein AB7E95_12325, partial [Kiritimatiellales bacterium]